MNTSSKAAKRHKTNFMMERDILIELQTWVPSGERSDFVNEVLRKAIRQFKREKAFKAMDELREKANIRMTTEEMIRRKNYGRP